LGKISKWLELFKVKQSALLILAGILGYFIGAPNPFNITIFLVFLFVSILSVFGTTALNMYFDRDIDAIMFRTRNRPLPAGEIDPDEAFFVALTMTIISIVIAYQLNFWTGTAVTLGFLIDAFLYSVLLKRKTTLNIVVGAFAGGMLPFGGYVLATGAPDIYSLILMLIITLWAMLHIWFIAIYYIEDYKSARIPMFPVVYGEMKTAKLSIVILLVIQSIIAYMWYTGFIGLISLVFSLLMTILTLQSIIRYIKKPERFMARKIFKFLSPYLGTILLFMALERMGILQFIII